MYLGHTRVDNLDSDYEFSIDKVGVPIVKKTVPHFCLQILIHKYYDGKHGLKFDIAILRLSRPIDFDDAHSKVKCVCQPEAIENLNLGRCMTMGWGSIVPVKNQMAIYTDDLLEVDIPVLEDRKCLSSVADFNRHWHICAMTTEGGRDSCKGKSVQRQTDHLFLSFRRQRRKFCLSSKKRFISVLFRRNNVLWRL